MGDQPPSRLIDHDYCGIVTSAGQFFILSTDRLSVTDVLFELSKVELIVDEKSGDESLAQAPKRTREITALFLEALLRG